MPLNPFKRLADANRAVNRSSEIADEINGIVSK